MAKIDPIINQQLDALLFEETNLVANLSNASALLKSTIENINWAGFYLFDSAQNELILGPFQGNVACMHIKNGSGVCGTALQEQKIIRVANVHEFPGHIACDSASNSEIVLPLFGKNGSPIGVLDIDFPSLDRFSTEDQTILTGFRDVLLQHIDTVA
ncbi:GAF domain-containing protein [Pediococcus claussenii]|uniref:GAF domain-containing protein n=1 Tax=Pediococcus claussenii TaxID=187452 RepID=UPI00081A4E4D|nr:GAF domain-containing protein [Pediococcus claussenii]ANZ70171.1 histidine kinase [Pediococcus claussenii]ANZ71987.1 histidine kinase [Pediococcus claussenii]